jgi:hypothetical protein
MKVIVAFTALMLALGGFNLPASAAEKAKKRLTDAQVRKILIEETIAAYPGNCPCPYNTARNGSQCGGRSAYSRKGGEAPLCYTKDLTAEMIQAYRDANPE